MVNPLISEEQKDKLITDLKIKSESGIPTNYKSPAWKIIDNTVNSVQDAIKVMSDSWIIGFTEVKGSFYLGIKDSQLLVHIFKITQTLDIIVLEAMALILKVIVITNITNNTAEVTGSKNIQNIVKFYHQKMKGMKALEYKIWARSFTKNKIDFDYMTNIQNLMENIRYIRLDKTLKLSVYK